MYLNPYPYCLIACSPHIKIFEIVWITKIYFISDKRPQQTTLYIKTLRI